MSQPSAMQKKKKKGRAPAHQNTFAFRHNPKSKKTAKILSSPVHNCCRRCREKIVWRKQYRKYKPLTQPATCNQCHRKNITAAYHTICKNCSTDSVAFRRVQEEYPTARRACEVCAKLPVDHIDNDDDTDSVDEAIDLGRLKLREVKTLERQRQRKEMGEKGEELEDSGSDEEEAVPVFEDLPHHSEDVVDSAEEDDEDDEDPFLAAIGGKILTGKAYQDHQLLLATGSKREL
jgi:Uncharacterized conserved protein (DUF2039)